MAREIVRAVHHPDKRHVEMPYAPALLVRGGQLLFLSGLTAAPVYHSHPHREEEFDLPPRMREQAVLLMENLRTTLAAAGCTLADVAAAMTRVASPREAAERAEVVFTMVTDDAALDAVTRGPQGILAGLRPGAILIEMSTVSPAVIHRLADEVAARGAALLDAPVSGSPATLDAGQLSFMVGGNPAVLERARRFLSAIDPHLTHVSPAELAQSMKIAVNQGLAVQMLVFAESVLLAEKAGVARERAVEVLLKSVLASPMVKYRGPLVLGMPAEAWFDVDMMH